MRVPQEVRDADGLLLTVRRAWPHDDGRLTLEAVEDHTGRLRAGRLGAGGALTLAAFAEDPALPDLPTAAENGQLLVHRYRKRAVIRGENSYLKVLPAAKAPDVARRHRAAATFAAAAGFQVPQVIGLDGGTLELSVVPGTSLHDLGRASTSTEASMDRAWASWAASWAGFVRSAEPSTAVVPVHGPEEEARTLAAWVARGLRADALRSEERLLEGAAHRARAALLDGAPQESVLAHRDLHDKQVFVDPGADRGAVGLIDCDTLAFAEPALDLANLLVHLEFRQAQGLLTAASRASGEQAILDVAETLEVPTDRLAAYALSARVRLACVYAFRPRWQDLAATWLRGA